MCRNWHFDDGWLHHIAEIVASYTQIDMQLLARYFGLSNKEETTGDFAERFLGYVLTDADMAPNRGAIELRQYETKRLSLSENFSASSGREEVTKQEQHVCTECRLAHTERYTARPEEDKNLSQSKFFKGKMCPATYYCSLCAESTCPELAGVHHCTRRARSALAQTHMLTARTNTVAACMVEHS